MNPRCSIIIAARNEESVIDRCLTPIACPDGPQIIVVCNGCTDDTASRARRYAGVTTIELPEASKTAALRAGDRAAAPDVPRIYLDADVVIDMAAVRGMTRALTDGPALVARPPVTYQTDAASWPVASWYRVRRELPTVQRALWGAGVYALSVRGRARFGEFPEIVSDDRFIESLFTDNERVIISDGQVVVTTPRAVSDLLRTRRRGYRTQSEVPMQHGRPSNRRRLRAELVTLVKRRPGILADALLYAAVIAIARLQAKVRSRSHEWERDESSRQMQF